jgi:hypothetical protein
VARLSRLLECAGVDADVTEGKFGGLDFLTFTAEPLTERALMVLSSHSHLRLLFEVRPDGALMPLTSSRQCAVGGELSSILKYKGKTSELFTRSLLSLAVLESEFSGEMFTRLTLFDPMCGRGTTLFEALNRGWNAVGSDIDASEVDQGYAFLKRYLEYGRFKHAMKDFSMTVGNGQVRRRQIELTHDEGRGRRRAHPADQEVKARPSAISHQPSARTRTPPRARTSVERLLADG